jgi:hypothetical protein
MCVYACMHVSVYTWDIVFRLWKAHTIRPQSHTSYTRSESSSVVAGLQELDNCLGCHTWVKN